MIRIGTRGSQLALQQAVLVQEALKRADGRIETELVIIHTRGDRIQDRPLAEIGDKGIFASELEQALQEGQIDLAVHSAKDLPVKLMDGLVISAVLKRADVRDVLVVLKGGRVPHLRGDALEEDEIAWPADEEGHDRRTLAEAPHSFRIGSGSRRRQMLAGQIWENIICTDIRGNVDTRLRKLQEGNYDGILLAKAGLDRLGIGSKQEDIFDFYPLSPELFLPAACQGIIAVEAVEGSAAAAVCKKITDQETEISYLVERETLSQLSADCSEAAAAWCRRGKKEQNPEAMHAADGQSTEAADELLLDVMYAGNRVRLTCAAEVEEGIRLARQAAQMVKENTLRGEE